MYQHRKCFVKDNTLLCSSISMCCGGVFICVKNYIDCREYGLMRILRWQRWKLKAGTQNLHEKQQRFTELQTRTCDLQKDWQPELALKETLQSVASLGGLKLTIRRLQWKERNSGTNKQFGMGKRLQSGNRRPNPRGCFVGRFSGPTRKFSHIQPYSTGDH